VSLLSMMQSVTVRVGLGAVAQVVTNPDPQVQQMLALAVEEGEELAARSTAWQALTQQASFSTLAQEDQGAIATILGSQSVPSDFRILNDTIWNRSLQRPVYGPRTPAQWQMIKAQFQQGPFNQYRIRGGRLLFVPDPQAGQQCFFEWSSNCWCTDNLGTTFRTAWAADDDIGLLSERIMALGVLWRWKSAKGFEYAEDFAKYERAVNDALTRDATKQTVDMSGGSLRDFPPVVIIPTGGWNL
jgi:hypothetical protein